MKTRLILSGCTSIRIQGESAGVRFAFDVTVDNVYLELPPIGPPEPREWPTGYQLTNYAARNETYTHQGESR